MDFNNNDSSSDFNIGFIGFGLIAGSMAKAIRSAYPNCTIIATSRTLSPLYDAQNDGVINKVISDVDSDYSNCDFIFLCTPVLTITKYLGKLKGLIKPTCIITDVGSVKGTIHETVNQLGLEDNFIGGHPMAGSELSGYVNSSAAILKNANYVITPTSHTTNEQLNSYSSLVSAMGSIPRIMDYKLHDYSVAGISHLPHLIAASLTKLIEISDDPDEYMHLLASSGFKDTTRIAASSPEMWEQICESNADAITELLTNYIEIITDVRDNIKSGSNGYITNLFDQSRSYRNTFDK